MKKMTTSKKTNQKSMPKKKSSPKKKDTFKKAKKKQQKPRRNTKNTNKDAKELVNKFLELAAAYEDFANKNDSSQKTKIRKEIYSIIDTLSFPKISALIEVEYPWMIDFIFCDIFKETSIPYFRQIELLERFVYLDIPQAMTNLGDIYSSHFINTPQEYKLPMRAAELYKKASEKKDFFYSGYAHARLAEMYALRHINENDFIKKSNKFLDKALKHASISANKFASPYGELILSHWHLDGFVVLKDWPKSFEYAQRAFEMVQDPSWDSLHVKSEIYLQYGYLVFVGIGCTPSEARGLSIIRESASMGNEDADRWLENYHSRNAASLPSQNKNDDSTEETILLQQNADDTPTLH